MKIGERIETLTKLGLTLNQARAYLALVQTGPAGARTLSEASKITRQDIYRVMLSLEQTGIVEKVITKPTVYKATSIIQATNILLERKISEQKELQKKTRELVRTIEDKDAENRTENVDTKFVMIPGKEAIIQKLGEALQKTQKTLQVVTSRERFSPAIIVFKESYANALERGVIIQIATEQNAADKSVLKILQNLMINSRFAVRCFVDAPEAIVSIFDGTQASVTIRETANNPKASALWSNDASFIAITQSYFRNKWNDAVEFVAP